MSVFPNLSALSGLSISSPTETELRRDRSFSNDDRDRDRDRDRDNEENHDNLHYSSPSIEEDNQRSQYSKSTLVAKCIPFEFDKFVSTSGLFYQNVENKTGLKFTAKTLLDDVNYFYKNFKFPLESASTTNSLLGFQQFDQTRILPVEVGRTAICNVLDNAKSLLTLRMIGTRDEKDVLISTGYYERKDLTGKHIYVLGDLHGSLHSLCEILLEMDEEGAFYKTEGPYEGRLKKNVYVVCTGDLLDRSVYTLEVAYLMLRLFTDNPDQVTITLGNHETDVGQWLTQNGTMNEIMGEYENKCDWSWSQGLFGRNDQMATKLRLTLLHFPMSFIAKTNLGVVQFNHGTFQQITKPSDINTFLTFTTFKGPNDRIPVFDHQEKHLNWGDLATDPNVSGVREVPSRPLQTSNELDAYLTTFVLRMLIRGHADMANLSLVYRNGSAPSSNLQAEDAQPIPPGNDNIIWNYFGLTKVDKRSPEMVTPHGKFVLGIQGLERHYLYDMYTLSFLPNTGRVTKTLVQQGRDDESQNDLQAVTSSTSVFSKFQPPFMTKSCFLYLEG